MKVTCNKCKHFLSENLFIGRYSNRCTLPPAEGWANDYINGGKHTEYDSCWANRDGECKNYVYKWQWIVTYFKGE